MEKIEITQEQRRKLERLWMYYGNQGPKTTYGNHRFIQGILERGEYGADHYKANSRHKSYEPLTDECQEKVDQVLNKRESQAQ